MWLWRKLEKVNWSDRISNEEVLTMVNALKNYTSKEKKLDRTCAERKWTVEGRARRKNAREGSSRQAERKNAGRSYDCTD